jgi:putative endopeptidase
MKKVFLVSAFCLAVASAGAQNNLSSGINKADLNTSVRPGDDFFEYAAGGWMKSHPLDAEHSSNGGFEDAYELSEKQIRELIEEIANTPQKKGSLGDKIGTLYRMKMDSVRLNKEGYDAIKPVLERVKAIKSKREYQLVMAQLSHRGIGTLMFGIGVGADQRDAANNLVSIGQGGIGLGERDYYLNDDEATKKVRDAYKKYMKTLFTMTGTPPALTTDS